MIIPQVLGRPAIAPMLVVATPTVEMINEEHRLANRCVGEAVQHAVNCGLMLLEVKASLKHGEWLSWLAGEIESGRLQVGTRQVQRYVRLASNTNRESYLLEAPSIRAALELLTDHDPDPITGDLLSADEPLATPVPPPRVATPDPAAVIEAQRAKIEALERRIDAQRLQEASAAVLANEPAQRASPASPASTADPRKMGYIGASPVAERDSNDWHTPSRYIEAARVVLGRIDLDPFSSATANETVRADRFFTVDDDALNARAWCDAPATVWMNPPFGRGVIDQAINRFLVELPRLSAAIVLVNNATETQWFQALSRQCLAICFPDHRIAFDSPDNKQESGNTRGQAFFLFGGGQPSLMTAFDRAFGEFGMIVERRL